MCMCERVCVRVEEKLNRVMVRCAGYCLLGVLIDGSTAAGLSQRQMRFRAQTGTCVQT